MHKDTFGPETLGYRLIGLMGITAAIIGLYFAGVPTELLVMAMWLAALGYGTALIFHYL